MFLAIIQFLVNHTKCQYLKTITILSRLMNLWIAWAQQGGSSTSHGVRLGLQTCGACVRQKCTKQFTHLTTRVGWKEGLGLDAERAWLSFCGVSFHGVKFSTTVLPMLFFQQGYSTFLYGISWLSKVQKHELPGILN